MGMNMPSQSLSAPDLSRPTVQDLQGSNRWVQTATSLWLKDSAVRRAKHNVIKKEIWDGLESESFAPRSLLILETLQVLEGFLWPNWNEDASNYHVLLIAMIVDVKLKEGLPIWDHFNDRPAEFSQLFRRILSMNLDQTLPTPSRLILLSFVIGAFQSLETGVIRKECAPLVSISTWHNLHSDQTREGIFEKNGQLKKAWRAAAKRYDAADEQGKAKIRFERSWLYTLILDFIDRVNNSEQDSFNNLRYCERFMEFLIDLESQLPTRRFTNTLIRDLNLLPVIKLSKLYSAEGNSLFRDFFALLRHFVNFALDDHAGRQYSAQEAQDLHNGRLAGLQRAAIKHFKDKLTILALSNYASIDQREELEVQLKSLKDTDLEQLCTVLGFRTLYPKAANLSADRRLHLEILLSAFERTRSFQESTAQLDILPTENNLYEPALLRNENYDGSRSLAVPKLNLQYLSLGDFLWRSFLLHRSESLFEIRKDAEAVVRKLQPRRSRDGKEIEFAGFSRMALPISKPAIIEVAPAKVGQTNPAFVRAEISLNVSRLNESICKEWDTLRPDDVIFLLTVDAADKGNITANGSLNRKDLGDSGLVHVRSAEVVQVLDENGRPLREFQSRQANRYSQKPRLRRLLVNLDAKAFKADSDRVAKGKPDIYNSINVIARRKGRENNFNPVLKTMQKLTVADTNLPAWFQEVFLGYGDPKGAHYSKLSNRIKSVDFQDTFLDWQHLIESFPGKTIEPSGEQTASFGPPYVLESPQQASTAERLNPAKKRRRDRAESIQPASESIKVSTYKPKYPGPYPMDAPKLNRIRFTPAQVDAIVSGTQPGLTVIVGPPGTGKTDVVTQTISNIYHNFPEERTLLIAHSNQALNQLFQKIIALDIDERHLLRLGHGEEDLDTETSYSKHGRVESFLENRTRYLAEVDRLAASIGAQGAHGNSCETAGYFNTVYIQPTWMKFWDTVQSSDLQNSVIIESFPFHAYFSNAPQPLFYPENSREVLLETASGCQKHIEKIFTELEDIRPFEILRLARDKANYLLIKEARIIAMTSTHAAMRRQEIADLGFHYDSVVMEEAAQITEIESFIPCALQKPKNGELPLKRVILCGDHLQNSPVIQNQAFRQYANFEQSLFLRLVRLGVPTINLDQQGRTRPSIAELFRWRYPNLGNLPIVETAPEYKIANAGFKFEYQFINVPDYQGFGEREPTPHFIQNLGEAEYVVAIYQYMRLLGYPASKISILTTYAGQRALIRDVLQHRCAKNALFGVPKIVTTVDKYQGEQNDYTILSLTRTKSIGYLRDVRRLTVALSRARLGLYILGRREVFASCYELKPAFDILFQRPDSLMLTMGEMYNGTGRGIDEEVEGTEMVGLEHLGQYVFEMTQAKVKTLGGEAVVEAADGDEMVVEDDGEGEEMDVVEGDEEDEDPLHEEVRPE